MADFGNISLRTTLQPEGNDTELANYDEIWKNLHFPRILDIITLVICLIGLVGNGIILWFLFFKTKKNNCTVYIINLAMADAIFLFGCVILVVVLICATSGVEASETDSANAMIIAPLLYNFGFNTSSFVLTAISVERCLCVLFPMWYQHRQLMKQSVIVSLALWGLSCMVMVLEVFICKVEVPATVSETCTGVYLFTSALYLLVVLLMVLSSLTLMIEIRKTSKESHPPRLYIVILVTVLIFLLSVVPARVLGLLLYFRILPSDTFLVEFSHVTFICSSIYCSANPYVFICVGMWNKHCFWSSIRQALERIFKDTETSWQNQSVDSLDEFEVHN